MFTESGFEQCAKQLRVSEDAADLAMRREAAMRSVQGKITAPKGGSSSSSSSTPRLQAIANFKRAGDFSKPAFARGEDEKFKLNDLVMMSGETMAGHVRRFKKSELWADRNQVPLHTMTINKVVTYGLYLDEGKCADRRAYTPCDRH